MNKALWYRLHWATCLLTLILSVSLLQFDWPLCAYRSSMEGIAAAVNVSTKLVLVAVTCLCFEFWFSRLRLQFSLIAGLIFMATLCVVLGLLSWDHNYLLSNRFYYSAL